VVLCSDVIRGAQPGNGHGRGSGFARGFAATGGAEAPLPNRTGARCTHCPGPCQMASPGTVGSLRQPGWLR